MKAFKGKVWKFGNYISTDLLMPGRSRHGKVDRSEMKYYCLQDERPEFAQNVQPGDIIVAGRNFGCGSSRPAVTNLKELGVSCVVAESFSMLFFRNCVSVAFPLLICEGVTHIFEEGDVAEVLFTEGKVHNLTRGTFVLGKPYPSFLLRIIEEGGLLEMFRQQRRLANMI